VRTFLPLPGLDGSPDELPRLAREMHRLQGSAGQVAAEDLRLQAADVEVACRTSSREHVSSLLTSLEARLRALASSAAPLLVSHQAEERAPRTSAAPPLPPAILALIDSLRAQRLEALDELERLTPALRASLGETRYLELAGRVESLEFQDAVDLLEPLTRDAAEGTRLA
jgi:Hpt domain